MKASVRGSTAIDPALVERFAKALDRLNPEGGKLGLAVSGGPDSMAMLLLAQKAIPGAFEVATVDHGLRPEAKDECALVVAACEEREVPCQVLTVKVAEGNVQAKAREARYEALADWATDRDLDLVATAHHLDDQVETFFMRLNRASGVSGLACIRESDVVPHPIWIVALVRPLLGFRREELAAIVATASVSFAHDPSNSDDKYDRVRVRQALAQSSWINFEAVARSAQHIARADEALTEIDIRMVVKNLRHVDGVKHFRPTGMPSLDFRFLQQVFTFEGRPARGEAVSRLQTSLMRGEGGNIGGVLVTVEGDEWVFRPEPPRKTKGKTG